MSMLPISESELGVSETLGKAQADGMHMLYTTLDLFFVIGALISLWRERPERTVPYYLVAALDGWILILVLVHPQMSIADKLYFWLVFWLMALVLGIIVGGTLKTWGRVRSEGRGSEG